LLGVGAGLLLLVLAAALLGPALLAAPVGWLKLLLGVLLLVFGLRWLRKAVLHAAGVLPLRDEAAAYDAATRRFATDAHRGWDGPGFAAAFQIVLIEGAEVILIVLAVGAGGGGLLPASAGAAAAVALVVLLGVLLHRPVAELPENIVKMAVGVLLVSFGTFWIGESVGIWPGGDWMLPILILLWAGAALAGIRLAGPRRLLPRG
jgi:uncharacterized membrane protein